MSKKNKNNDNKVDKDIRGFFSQSANKQDSISNQLANNSAPQLKKSNPIPSPVKIEVKISKEELKKDSPEKPLISQTVNTKKRKAKEA